jgi:hypothetical protein
MGRRDWHRPQPRFHADLAIVRSGPHQPALASTPSPEIVRQDTDKPPHHFHITLEIVRQDTDKPPHHFHADNRGFVL